MFGIYENFPEIHQGIARFSHAISAKKLQRVLIQSLYKIDRNNDGPNLPEFTRYNIEVELELGIADGLTFNYIDKEMSRDCQERIRRKPFPMLDFICIVRYYAVQKKRRSPLRFDYYMLRFSFSENEVELQVYHERGTRRLPIDELVNFLTERINRGLARKKLSPLKTTYMRAP